MLEIQLGVQYGTTKQSMLYEWEDNTVGKKYQMFYVMLRVLYGNSFSQCNITFLKKEHHKPITFLQRRE